MATTAAPASPSALPDRASLLACSCAAATLFLTGHLTCNTSSGSNPFSPLAAPSSCRKRRVLSLRPSGACPCRWPPCCCLRRKSRLRCKAALLSRCCCALVPLADRWVAADCQPGSAGAPACSALPMAASSRFTAAWMTCEAACNKVRELHAAPAGGCCFHGLQDGLHCFPQACSGTFIAACGGRSSGTKGRHVARWLPPQLTCRAGCSRVSTLSAISKHLG